MASRSPASRAADRLADPVRRAEVGKERVVVRRRGKAVAAVVPMEDLRFLERLEDRIYLAEAKRALADPRRTSYEQLRKKLGL
jgi:prevent-host-death family protein